jgi:hypothetical protein
MDSTLSYSVSHTPSSTFDELALALSRAVDAAMPHCCPFEVREQAILEAANEIARRALRAELQQIADSHTHEVRVGSRRYRRHESGSVGYHTLAGNVVVQRFSYREVGVRNGPTIVPLDLAAGLFENATPALVRCVAEGIAEMPSRRYEEIMRAAHRPIPSRSTTERLAKGAGNCIKQDILVFEAFARTQEPLPVGAHGISIGLDRTTVPMAEERSPSEPPKISAPRKKPRIRRAPPPIDVNYRMPYVGTVSVVDRNGDALVTRRYAATVEEGPDDLVHRIRADLLHLRHLDPMMPVAVVQDGAPELWGLMWDLLRSVGIPQRKWNNVIDRFHITERIAAVVNELYDVPYDSPERRAAVLNRWRRRMDRSDYAVRDFCRWAQKQCVRNDDLVEDHLYYLRNHLEYTRYRRHCNKGLPTGSGVTEGACKSLITARCKRNGQRWQQDGLTAILTLRSTIQSGRMPTIWPQFMRRFRDSVECVA